jgi:integrase
MKRSDHRITLPDGTRVPKIKNLCLRADVPYWQIRVNGKRVSTDIPIIGKSQIETQGNYKRAIALLLNDQAAAPPKPEPGVELINGDVPTLANYAPIWKRRYMVHHAPATRVREDKILDTFVKRFGALALSELTDTMVIDWRNERRQQFVPRTTRRVTASTVNRDVDVLKQVLSQAVADKHLKTSPLAGLARLPKVNRPLTALSFAQLQVLLQTGFQDKRDRAMTLLAIHAYARLTNMLGVQWRDFKNTTAEDLVELHFDNTKNGTPYVALIPRDVYDEVVRDVPHIKGEPFVFTHRRQAKNPEHWRSIVRKMFAAACKKARIPYGREHHNEDGEHEPGVTFHRLRSSSASVALLRGATIQQVKVAGNWKSMSALEQHYLTTFSAEQRAMAKTAMAGLVPLKEG